METLYLKIKRDGSVKYWNVYTQSFEVTTCHKLLTKDKIMSTLNARERARVEAAAFGQTLQISKQFARLALKFNDNGIVPPEVMLKISGDPRNHSCMKLEDAAKKLGFYYALDLLQWDKRKMYKKNVKEECYFCSPVVDAAGHQFTAGQWICIDCELKLANILHFMGIDPTSCDFFFFVKSGRGKIQKQKIKTPYAFLEA